MKFLLPLALLCLSLASRASVFPHLIPYRDGDRWGYCDSAGNVKIQPQWDEADFFCGGKAVVKINRNTGYAKDDAYALIDTTGRYIIPPSWHWNRQWKGWRETMLNAHDDSNRYGLIDTAGDVLIPFQYDPPSSYGTVLADGYKIVGKAGRLGLIDEANKTLIPCQYQHMAWLALTADSTPLFSMGQNWRFGIIDPNGREILPARYSGISNESAPDRNRYPHRNGLKLFQKQLIDPRDSSKGMRDIQGWTDYTGRLLITPKYNAIYWLNDRYYVGDERLYRGDQKRALPKTFFHIYRTGDTIFATRKGRSRKDRVLFYRYAFTASDLHKLSVIPTWEMKPGRDKGRSGAFCGGVHDIDAERREEQRHGILIDGKYQKRFSMNGIFWTSGRWLGDGNVAIQGYSNSRNTYDAVITTEGRLMTSLIPDKGEIVGFNPGAQLLIWKQGLQYGVSATSGSIQVSLQDKIISDAFYDDGGMLYTVRSDPFPRDPYSDYNSGGNEMQAVQAGASPRLFDETGRPVPAFRNYDFIERAGSGKSRFTDTIKVADSTGRHAIMRLDGDTAMPKISFKYTGIKVIAPDLFLVLAPETKEHLLVNSRNENILPGADVRHVSFLRDSKQVHTELLYDHQIVNTDLIIAYYLLNKSGEARSVLMNEHGRVYGGKL